MDTNRNSVSRRKFLSQTGLALAGLTLEPRVDLAKSKGRRENAKYDVIIVGGSYSGLAAAMALGRALKRVLVIDGGKPCNAQTPHSHNFLTQDGSTPASIAAQAKSQVAQYENVAFYDGLAVRGAKLTDGFQIEVNSGDVFRASKLIFATGITDIMPPIPGFAECWGISVIHCPYCHGYEVRNQRTGIMANGEKAFEFAKLIANWTSDLTVYTNGQSTLTSAQMVSLERRNIRVVEKTFREIVHVDGLIKSIVFADGTQSILSALYAPRPFVQHSSIPESLGCAITDEGYIKTDNAQQTSVPGIYACGDNSNRMRTVANAVGTGTTAGMSASKAMILEQF